MEEPANVGETVIYTGDLSYAKDNITKLLMKENLIVGNWYRVQGIRGEGMYKDHYFYNGALYPYKSFVRSHRDFCKERYNLK